MRKIMLVLVSIATCIPFVSMFADSLGQFIGPVRTEWCDDGRKMRLLSAFAYKDPSNHVWTAPVNSIIDGASIPRIFWTIAGGPFEGKYRKASVVHDVA